MIGAMIHPRNGRPVWRIAGWGLALVLLVTPAVAMQFTSGVNWTPGDFVVAALMLILVGTAIELILRSVRSGSTRVLAIVAVIGAFRWLWSELAVGVFTSWGR